MPWDIIIFVLCAQYWHILQIVFSPPWAVAGQLSAFSLARPQQNCAALKNFDIWPNYFCNKNSGTIILQKSEQLILYNWGRLVTILCIGMSSESLNIVCPFNHLFELNVNHILFKVRLQKHTLDHSYITFKFLFFRSFVTCHLMSSKNAELSAQTGRVLFAIKNCGIRERCGNLTIGVQVSCISTYLLLDSHYHYRWKSCKLLPVDVATK
jgi:hypothetical protein